MLKPSCLNGLFPRNNYSALKPTSSYQTIESLILSAIFGVYYISALIIVHVRHMVSFFHTPTLKKISTRKKSWYETVGWIYYKYWFSFQFMWKKISAWKSCPHTSYSVSSYIFGQNRYAKIHVFALFLEYFLLAFGVRFPVKPWPSVYVQ